MKKFAISLIAFVIFCVSAVAQQEITLDKLWKTYDYYANSVPGFRFMNDGKHYTTLEEGVIKKYDLTTGDFVEDLFIATTLKGQDGFEGKMSNYRFNVDETKIMIGANSESIYRRSSKADYFVYDRSSKKLTSIFSDDKIMFPTLSPEGDKVAYVWKNDIYYKDLKTNITLPVTSDGSFNNIINGAADWVYEEEFAIAKCFFWSPKGDKISYLRFDESEVKEFIMTNYKDGLYPEYVKFKYPKVGEKNADVSVHIFDLKKEKTTNVDIGNATDIYIPRIKWLPNNKLCVYKMNRHQNELELLSADAKNGKTKTMLRETNEYYIDITDDLTFIDDGKKFIWSSEKNGYNQLYLYNSKGEELKNLTPGSYDVTSFYGYDEERKRVFYQAAEISPLERQVFSVDLKGKNKIKHAVKPGTNRAQFSSTYDYYVLNHSTINSPASYTVYDYKNKAVRTIVDNADLREIQKESNVTKTEFFKIKTSENVELNAYMIKPSNFSKDSIYPLFMYLYGGPGSQQVTDSWKGQNYWWFQMLAQQGYVVACVDNRGTGGRGEEFKKMTYLNLGKYETIDQIEAAKWLGNQSYIDKDRIGIFGWSYGGYMSTLCLLKGNDVFKSAIAVAPVTNWKWYDTIYTERYMRTEAENEAGYKENSPVYFADQLKGNYLLVHGMGDDNVHFQNSAEMANALIASNKQFDTYYYPNRNHGIYGGPTRLHLYQKMTDFILEKL